MIRFPCCGSTRNMPDRSINLLVLRLRYRELLIDGVKQFWLGSFPMAVARPRPMGVLAGWLMRFN